MKREIHRERHTHTQIHMHRDKYSERGAERETHTECDRKERGMGETESIQKYSTAYLCM
jgi:hypothetical protein